MSQFCRTCGAFNPPDGHVCKKLDIFINKLNLEPVGEVHSWSEERWRKETEFLHRGAPASASHSKPTLEEVKALAKEYGYRLIVLRRKGQK